MTGDRSSLERYETLASRNYAVDDPVARHALAQAVPEDRREEFLHQYDGFGAVCALTLDTLARETNRDENLPRLDPYDGFGRLTERVVFHPSHHEIGRFVYGTGMMSRYAEPDRETETLGLFYLLAHNGEGGHCCPLACTAGLIRILQGHGSAELRERWLPRLLDPNYDTHAHGAQFLTEVQGGSDVGANTLRAVAREDGTFALHGEKWFCSVANAPLWLVTARPEGAPEGTRGLAAFLVPRELDGRPNGFRLRRLKTKLGTRSMASGELDFQGTVAWPIGELDKGFKIVVEQVLNTSRIYNAMAAAGTMRRAYLEAKAYAQARTAFGRPIIDYPLVHRNLAQLRVEATAAFMGSLHLAELGDRLMRGTAPKAAEGPRRMLVNLNKYFTAVACSRHVLNAIEVLGGNGAIETFSVLPRLLRDAIVIEQWEGTHNVLCAQAERDGRRFGLWMPTLDHVAGLCAEPSDALRPVAERVLDRLTPLRERVTLGFGDDPDEAAFAVRAFADELRPLFQAAALCHYARGITDADVARLWTDLGAALVPSADESARHAHERAWRLATEAG